MTFIWRALWLFDPRVCLFEARHWFETKWRASNRQNESLNNHNDRQMNVITIIIHIKIHCYNYLDLYTSLFCGRPIGKYV